MDFSGDGRFWVRSHGADALPYDTDDATETEIYTNTATGESVTWVINRRARDLHVTDNGDGTWTFVEDGTGHNVLYAEDGQVLARQAGLFRYAVVEDIAGTPLDRSDDVHVAGPEILLWKGRNDDFCAVTVAALS